jgi:2-polyprenyl-3-methyl-5-hydroxy-6-metoxy-1,4-benzoquinol methylase
MQNDAEDKSELLGFAAELEVVQSLSPIRPLFSSSELDGYVKSLKVTFEQDQQKATQQALHRWRDNPVPGISVSSMWFQRISLEGHGITTTSDHSTYNGENPGPLNTLWGRLKAIEGTVLRPLPKWCYLQKLLPPLLGKTVLEIGSACGFGPLKLASLGARFASGIEVVPLLVEQARSAASVNGNKGNVHFVLGDAYLDPSVPPHDIVLMSEVLIHSIFPDFSLLRALNLAKEFLIIDDFFRRDQAVPASLHLMRDYRTGKITWTGFTMTEALLLQFLHMYGIEPSKVMRYHDPMGEHSVIVVDTRHIQAFRSSMIGHDSLTSSVKASMLRRSYEESLRDSAAAHLAPKPIVTFTD